VVEAIGFRPVAIGGFETRRSGSTNGLLPAFGANLRLSEGGGIAALDLPGFVSFSLSRGTE
jgi:hypothetical protein